MKLGKHLDFLGHATTVVELGGLRVLTDPVLRPHLAFLERQVDAIPPDRYAGIDVVVISHLHWDHLDLPSLRRLDTDPAIVVPQGAGDLMRRNGFESVTEMVPGDSATFGDLLVTATPAIHSGFRPPFGPDAPSLGFLLEDRERRIYFAGDTDIFPEMAKLERSRSCAVADLGLGAAARARSHGSVSCGRGAQAPPAKDGGAYPLGHVLAPRRRAGIAQPARAAAAGIRGLRCGQRTARPCRRGHAGRTTRAPALGSKARAPVLGSKLERPALDVRGGELWIALDGEACEGGGHLRIKVQNDDGAEVV